MMHTNVDWSRPLTWAIAASLVLLLALQVWLLSRKPGQPRRRVIRAVLNALLWLALVGYALQPAWYDPTPATHALLVGDEVPDDRGRAEQARLGLGKRFTPRNFTGDFARVTLLGQSFPAELLSRLSRTTLDWIPYHQPDQLQAIHWQGLVRQGDVQRVSGRIQSGRNQWLRLGYAGQTLDSVRLTAGSHAFALQGPVFARGRTELELTLGDIPLDTLRFFARPPEPMAYQFILDNPDFETKTLANWLGRTGQAVQLTSTVSTSVRNSLTINQPKARVADVLITDPSNAANPVVKRAVLVGKRVLFINLTNPEADVQTINRALGSRFSVRKLANAESIPVGAGLTALPFAFTPMLSQQLVTGYPVAVQRPAGLVGVSLLNETFPLALSGDSVAYARLWYALLAPLRLPGRNNVQLDAPLFSGLRGTIQVNNTSGNRALVRVGTDTARLCPSPINPLSASGSYRFNRTGWLPLADSLPVFVDRITGNTVGKNQLVGSYLLAHDTQLTANPGVRPPAESSVTDWVWFALLIGCFTALWVEPKLG